MKTTLTIGWAQTDITPDKSTPLSGQFHTRLSTGVLDPLTATALAIASADASESVLLVSMDAVWAADATRDQLRARLAKTLPDFDPRRLVIGGTHTHTAPSQVSRYLDYPVGDRPDLLSQEAYTAFLVDKLEALCRQAWTTRQPGGFAFGRAPAVIGHNRRAVYENGDAVMYGATDRDDFSHVEGAEHHYLDALFTYDPAGALTGMVLNVACPSQVSERLYQVSADFWHDTRREIRARLGANLFLLPQCGAAGDQSPHIQTEKAAARRMLERIAGDAEGPARRREIAGRIADAAAFLVPLLGRAPEYEAEFAHRVLDLELPRYRITEADVARFSAIAAESEARRRTLEAAGADPLSRDYSAAAQAATWYGRVERNFRKQDSRPTFTTEVHVLRLGEAAFATSRFELYLDYGLRIKCRSRAVLTFVVQLCGEGSYLPTERALRGGGYGAIAPSILAGPEGGRCLVEATLSALNALFDDPTS